MAEQVTPYVEAAPGDLITSQSWNRMQEEIKEDIANSISTAVAAIKTVDQSRDAEKVGGRTTDELAQHVLDYVIRQLPKRTGYLSVFKKLEVNRESVIDHKLGAFPLVDVYQLDYFEVVASEDGHISKELATFFIHHASESRIRFRPEEPSNQPVTSVPIDPPDGHPYHVPFKHLLELYGVDAPEDSTLSDLENEFWQAFNAPPNDRFDDNQIFHSPWFDRCCGERRTVRSLGHDMDDLYVQFRPRKTANYPDPDLKLKETDPTPAPSNVQVSQFDFDSLGLKLLAKPVIPKLPKDWPADHLKVLVLLKV